MNFLKGLPFLFVLLFGFNASAQTYCEQFSSAQLKERYNANFLNMDLRGCFTDYFSQGARSETDAVASFSIIFGKQLKLIDGATSSKIAFSVFSGITSYQQTNKQLGDDADTALQSIREQSKISSNQMTEALSRMSNTYSEEALPAIKINTQQIKSESEDFNKKILTLNNQLKDISPSDSDAYDLPKGEESSLFNDPVKRELAKWTGSKNINSVPFHVIEKIYKKNPELALQILDEVKYARYTEKNLMKPIELPLLNEVQSLDAKNKKFLFKYSNAHKNLNTNDTYYGQKKFVLTASYELKKIADQNTTEGNFQKAEDGYDMATLALDITTSLPLAATGRGLYEFFSGKSLLTDRSLSNFERGAALSIALIDLMPQAWIANGVRATWLVGKLGTRLIERGLIKAGFENALTIGVENAKLISTTLKDLVSNQLIKIETAKRIIEHRLFYNFLSEETYLASGAFKKNAIEMEKTLAGLGSAAENQTIEQEIFQANRIKHASEGAILKTSEEINEELKPFYSKPPFKKSESVLVNTVKENDEFIRFYKEGVTDPVGYFIARTKDAEGLTALEIQQKYALPYLPDRIANVKLPAGTTIFEGIAENFILDSGEILQGGGWQTYIKYLKSDKLPTSWFIETERIIK